MDRTDPPITITLPLSFWAAIGMSLTERPHKEVAHLIGAIAGQLFAQVEATAARAPDATVTTPEEPRIQ